MKEKLKFRVKSNFRKIDFLEKVPKSIAISKNWKKLIFRILLGLALIFKTRQ